MVLDQTRSRSDSEDAVVDDRGDQRTGGSIHIFVEDRDEEEGQPKRSISKQVAALAEGVRAIMYIFVEQYGRDQLDKCGQKLCGALHKFIDRLDAGILTLSRRC